MTETTASIQQQRSKAPKIPISLSDLCNAIERCFIWQLETIGPTPFANFTRALFEQLRQEHNELNRQRWMATHASTSIYKFNKAAKDFYDDIVTLEMADHFAPDLGASICRTRVSSLIDCVPLPTLPTTLAVLPPLSQLPFPPPAPPSTQHQLQPPPGGPHTGRGGRTRGGNQGGRGTDDNTSTEQAVERLKPGGPPTGYTAMWTSGTAYPTKQILVAAGTTKSAALTQLGLNTTECLNFHARGVCTSRMCRNQHTATATINSEGAAALLTKFIAAKAQL